MKVSLSTKIFVNYLILTIVPIIVIDSYFYYQSKEALIKRTFDQLATIRIEKSKKVIDFFKNTDEFINTISKNNFQDSTIKFNEKNFFYKTMIGKNKAYKNLFYVSNLNQLISYNVAENLHFKNLNSYPEKYHFIYEIVNKDINKRKPFIFDKKTKYTLKNQSILFIKNLYDNKKYGGTIILEISLNAIDQIVNKNTPYKIYGKTGEAYLVSSDYFMRTNSRFNKKSIFITKVKTKAVEDALSDISGNKIIANYSNEKVLSSYSRLHIKGLNWVILSELSVNEAMVTIYRIRNDIIFMSFVLSILLLGLVEILSSKITAPIKKLKLATNKIRKGQLGEFIEDSSNDEIGDLIIAFNKMNSQLKEQTKSLKKERILRTKSLLAGQEIERQRLSRELHDSLGQSILALKMKFEHIKEYENGTAEKLISEIDNLFSLIIKEIRNISNNLMPAVLTEFGLLLAIKKMIREIIETQKIEIIFEENLAKNKVNKEIEVHIYRIIQEAFSNIIKHAKAKKITLKISEQKNNLELIIIDNGKGFILEQTVFMRGNGISNIKERINLLGGNIEFLSEINKGTRINCLIPIKL